MVSGPHWQPQHASSHARLLQCTVLEYCGTRRVWVARSAGSGRSAGVNRPDAAAATAPTLPCFPAAACFVRPHVAHRTNRDECAALAVAKSTYHFNEVDADTSLKTTTLCISLHRTKDNPDGYTVLAVAENRQSIDLMQQRLARVAPIPREAFFYDSFQGVERFRKALANLLTNTFMKVRECAPAHECHLWQEAEGRKAERTCRLAWAAPGLQESSSCNTADSPPVRWHGAVSTHMQICCRDLPGGAPLCSAPEELLCMRGRSDLRPNAHMASCWCKQHTYFVVNICPCCRAWTSSAQSTSAWHRVAARS